MLNDFLKSQPIVILIAAFVMVVSLTPVVFLFSQQQTERELREREALTYMQLARSNEKTFELLDRMSRLEKDVSDLKSAMSITRENLNIAVKSLVEIQKQQRPPIQGDSK